MNRSNGTWTLFAIAALLLAYILAFERHPGDGADGNGPVRLFPQLDPARVTGFTIAQSNGIVRVERVEDHWRLTAPTYPAQELAIQNWLEAAAQLQRGARLRATEILSQPGGLASLGLDPARAEVTINQGDQRYHFRLGQRTPLGEKMYLQIVGSDGIDITGAQPLDRLPATPVDWRDTAFVNLVGLHADRLQMRAPGREFEVQREEPGRLWRLTRPRAARADQGRIEQMLQQLQELRVSRFVNDLAAADLEALGLQPPAATLTFADGTNPVLNIEFGMSPTNAPDLLYARRSNLPGIVLVPRTGLELVALSYTDLLDYRLMDAPLDKVDHLEVTAGARFVIERPPGAPWAFVEPKWPLDPALVAAFLERLRTLRVVDVAKEAVIDADLPSYGLVSPVRQYALRWPVPSAGTNSPTWLRVDFGTNRTDRVFARRSDETPVYALRLEDCVELPAAAFELRDRRIWEFSTNQVQSVTITHQGKPRTLLRSTGGQWAFAPGSQGIVNTFALEDAIHQFGLLRARRWRAQGTSREMLEFFGMPQVAHQLKIELLIDGHTETRTIDFGATVSAGGAPFGLVSLEGGPTVFEVPIETFRPYDIVVRSMDLPKPDPQPQAPTNTDGL